MSLYIRVSNSFWNHRKTAKLRTVIGDDALWIMPRIWSYASENQPDGNFSKYSSAELALLLGCPKHAQALLQALLQAGFMNEDMTLHDWDTHNGYHASYADRAVKGASARWRGHEKKRKERKGKEVSIATSNATSNASSISGPENTDKDWTFEDCVHAASSIAMKHEDIQAWWDHYASVGFIDAAGRRITNLKAALAKWKANQSNHAALPQKQGMSAQARYEMAYNACALALDNADDIGHCMSILRDKWGRAPINGRDPVQDAYENRRKT
jgi:hypothetical protein